MRKYLIQIGLTKKNPERCITKLQLNIYRSQDDNAVNEPF